jgi:hypothetical protein
MGKVFVSCGQFTDAEKSLGKEIVRIVKSVTGADAFFAEQVQDLNGLDSNILSALRDCSAFITVLHPRGKITRPDGSTHIRASVWIEQEIAIATYIQRVEKRSLPVIAFVHRSVGREGIRDLLHLNPIPFTDEMEILETLPELLQNWKSVGPGGIRISIEAGGKNQEQGHRIRNISLKLVNDSNSRITNFNGQICIPSGMRKHWSTMYMGEIRSEDPRYRCFRLDEVGRGAISPRSTMLLYRIDYCIECAAKETGEDSTIAFALVAQAHLEAKVWIEGREYSIGNTVEELEKDAVARGE